MYTKTTKVLFCCCCVFVVLTDSLKERLPPEGGSRQLSVLLVTGLYPGHLFPVVSLGEELVNRGHNVTLIANVMKGSDLYPRVPERVGISFVSAGYDSLFTQDVFEEVNEAMMKDPTNSSVYNMIFQIGRSSYVQIREKVEEIGMEKFDILVSEVSTLPVAAYFHEKGMKSVTLSTLMAMLPSLFPQWPAPLPSSGQSNNLSFLERLLNSVLGPMLAHMTKGIFNSAVDIDDNYRAMLGGVDLTSYPGFHIPMIYTTVMGLEYPMTRTPLVEYVGPVLAKTSNLPAVDKDLQEWLDSKEERTVIYISMGTTGYLSANNARALLEGVLDHTPYHALWVIRKKNREEIFDEIDFKWHDDRLWLAEWVPQQAVLAHRSILMTVLHCGLNGIQESLYNSLPVICTPFLYDQHEVATKIEIAGVGISLLTIMDCIRGKREFQAGAVAQSIRHVIEGDYVENARRMQKVFELAGGSRRAADLVEFYHDVGYDHLVPSFVRYEWSLVQYYNVDVWLVMAVVCGGIGWCVWRLVQMFCARIKRML